MVEPAGGGWLLLIHQIPPTPNYLRVKIGRRLQRLGAIAIKNSVYALPRSESAHEDLRWVLREITEAGGEGSLCEASFVDGLSDTQVQALFHAARDADYAVIAEEARVLAGRMPAERRQAAERAAELSAQVARLRRRLAEVAEIDHFGAPGREAAEGLVAEVERRLRAASRAADGAAPAARAAVGRLRRRTWVTRRGVHVDRMASAWLIRRFIDPQARFRFVAAREYRHKRGEVRFDMFAAEFTHEGDRCSFEVLLQRFELRERPLQAIAEIVHDIDIKDGKFGRPEALGIDRLVLGIALRHDDDEARVRAASEVWDGLYEYFRRKRA